MNKFMLCISALLLSTTAPAAAGTQKQLTSGDPDSSRIIKESSKRQLQTFLGNPKNKYDRIRTVLKKAQQEILLQRGYLNDYISEIIRNENRIASTDDRTIARRLSRSNILLLHKIERLRTRIAKIQLDAQTKVLRIEQQSYMRISRSASRQQRRIGRNPAAYWIWRRRHLLNSTELKDSLPGRIIRKYYRR